ncbi:MAG: DEAD/DEAH box helicase [Desulfurococcaceae archaeon]
MDIEVLSQHGYPSKYIEYLKQRGIVRLNPVQVEALRHGLLEDKNMVIVAPTASGKTLIAELALLKYALNKGMGVYLSPLKALANEKYSEFKNLEEITGVKVEISTGDYDQPAEYLRDAHIVVSTYERFDSLLRLKPSWLSKLSIIVIDEFHNINDPERGPVIEMIVARARRSKVRIIGLSASVGNPEELATWLNSTLVLSSWRPVKLVEGVFVDKDEAVKFVDGRVEKVEVFEEDPAIDLALHNIKHNYQTLVFVHNRKRVEELSMMLSKELRASGSRELEMLLSELEEAPTHLEKEVLRESMERGVGFHHAGLSYVARKVVEEAFRRRLLKVVYATPTLAAGVNLPARRVLVSIKRYDPVEGRKVGVSVAEYKQMSGRAGRPQFDELGESIIIDADSLSEGLKYITSQPEPVRGKFFEDERNTRIHVLSLLASSDAETLDELVELLKETFSSRSSNLDIASLISSTIDVLEQLRMITKRGSRLIVTRLGKVTSYSYLDPISVSMFLSYKPKNYSDLYVLHLIALTPDFARSSPYIPSRIIHAYEDLAEAYHESDLVPPMETHNYGYKEWIKSFVIALALSDWISEKREDEIYEKYSIGPGDLYNIKDTASWIASSLAKISGILGDVVYHRELLKLSQRLDKGVKPDALELASLRYIGRVRARILIEQGIKTLEDLAKTPRRKLLSLPSFGPRVVEEIFKQLEEMGYKPSS